MGYIATAASELLQDWKTGFLLGASPRKQLWAQLVGLLVGVFSAIPIYILFLRTYTLGSDELPAPVAFFYKTMSEVLAGGLSALPPYTGYAALCAWRIHPHCGVRSDHWRKFRRDRQRFYLLVQSTLV